MSKHLKTINNFILFKIGWLSCVMFGATDYHLLGTGIVVLVCINAVQSSAHPIATAKLIAAACLIGLLWESALISNGLLVYKFGQLQNDLVPAYTAPHWIIAMWALFASTLDHSMAWLKRNLWIGGVFGAVGGPLAFLAGEGLGAVVIPNTSTTLITLGVGWLVLTPILLALSRSFNASADRSKAVTDAAPLASN